MSKMTATPIGRPSGHKCSLVVIRIRLLCREFVAYAHAADEAIAQLHAVIEDYYTHHGDWPLRKVPYSREWLADNVSIDEVYAGTVTIDEHHAR